MLGDTRDNGTEPPVDEMLSHGVYLYIKQLVVFGYGLLGRQLNLNKLIW
jgi:hypothetical protein